MPLLASKTNMQDLVGVYLDSNHPPLPRQIVTAPYDYVVSLPSKGRRDLFTDALNRWLKVSESDTRGIKQIVDTLHNASIMVDDIQDESSQRRGRSSTHMVFGIAQTINSAMFSINEAIAWAQRLCGSDGVQVVIEELSTLYTGQSYDIHSSQNMSCPTVEEYIRTIDGKTGGLFELNARLMVLMTPTKIDYTILRRLVILLGRYYQLRDDYKGIQQPASDKQKAQQLATPWCEDLDGGKYTLPLIHLLNSGEEEHLIKSVLSMRHATGKMEDAAKYGILERLQRAGSLEYTSNILEVVHQELVEELDRVSVSLGFENPEMRLLIDMLKK
ncbi:uncharacterized protein TrAFT101_010786 [Trichoderma asperellum]|uniref:Uncharacterized protein n=1 Tax=Trichoderma asperellum (strain ATCC 204424 / CBS 433.97 / NBRC 101777) TaxID=1042311 RepID=A0A2T3YWY7_TRIA4|nr:hypothetical protein M441DRAFT_200788 [Trichoderma asperellum CBS 433.97]PTB37050.1 hypothetical protein M441DRAFT_200788 [Trichoderma asperellum CBS 433.97]UKZ95980.1 hypothetical protein TrAFT101_010786 [Trichoderma asperellum]